MAGYEGVLASIPGLGGYLASQQQRQGREAQQLQQTTGVLGLLSQVKAQEQQEQVQGVLARSQKLEDAIPELTRLGPMGIQAATQLGQLSQAMRKETQLQPMGAGGAFDPVTRQVIPPAARPAVVPSEIQGYEYAKSQGFTGSLLDYKKEISGAGRAAPAKTAAVQEYEAAQAQGFKGTFFDFKRQLAEAGRAPRQEQQAPASIQEYNLAKSQGYKGTFVDFKRKQADPAAGDLSKQSQIDQANSVLAEITDAKNLVSPKTTGFGGLASYIPQTEARDLQAKLTSIKANLGFDRLQQMRRESPTGGALGQVAVQELVALQSTVASLDQLQSPPQVAAALEKIEKHYTNWRDTVIKSRAADSGAPTSTGASGTWSIRPK